VAFGSWFVVLGSCCCCCCCCCCLLLFLLFGVCCLLFVVCCLLFVVCCLLFVVCCWCCSCSCCCCSSSSCLLFVVFHRRVRNLSTVSRSANFTWIYADIDDSSAKRHTRLHDARQLHCGRRVTQTRKAHCTMGVHRGSSSKCSLSTSRTCYYIHVAEYSLLGRRASQHETNPLYPLRAHGVLDVVVILRSLR